ncbi:MAG: hypothetical protein HQL08_15050 [Nitrospirae bacterium]|nr:hypothetical protein [Nitrospirota bacterium]
MNISQLSSTLLNTLFGQNTETQPDLSQNILKPLSQTNLISQSANAKATVAQLSTMGKGLNELYASVKKTGNEAAITGFKQNVASLAAGADSVTMQSFVKMGQEAFQKKDSAFFVNMLGDYNKLAGGGNAATGNALIKEAGATYKDQGLSAAKTYATTANNILNTKTSEKNNVAVTGAAVLPEFTSLWQQIRTQTNVDQTKIAAQEKDLANGIAGKTNALDIHNYIITQQAKRQ